VHKLEFQYHAFLGINWIGYRLASYALILRFVPAIQVGFFCSLLFFLMMLAHTSSNETPIHKNCGVCKKIFGLLASLLDFPIAAQLHWNGDIRLSSMGACQSPVRRGLLAHPPAGAPQDEARGK